MASTFNIPNMTTAHMLVGASTLIAPARIGDGARMATGVPAAARGRNTTVLAPRGAG